MERALLLSFLTLLGGVSESCSQDTSKPVATFVATTPCEAAKGLFGISREMQCDMMQWNLSLYQGSPSSFRLTVEYGIPKQGTKGFTRGSIVKEIRGTWTNGKGFNGNENAEIILLDCVDSPDLAFLKPDEGHLHPLGVGNQLLVGNGAWSFTLNRTNGPAAATGKFSYEAAPQLLNEGEKDTVGVFDARTPCHPDLMAIKGITGPGCQIIKVRMVLLQDSKSHTPTRCLFYSVYVGKGDERYTKIAKWSVAKGTRKDANAVVYVVEADDPKVTLRLQRIDENTFFFLDEGGNLLVGDSYTSFTLSRTK